MKVETNSRLRVLVVDDSALYRKVVSEVLAESPEIEVVGVAANGQIALEKIAQLAPDLITLDLEMPLLDGHGVLREIKLRELQIGVIILSALSNEGARATTMALEAGAFDFALKPTTSSAEQSKAELRQELFPKLTAYREAHHRRLRLSTTKPVSAPTSPASIPTGEPRAHRTTPAIIAIGISTGGPAALSQLIPRLPADLASPIVIVQHMPPVFTQSLADDLNKTSRLHVCEGRNGELLRPGSVTIAPGGKQMKVERGTLSPRVVITDDPPERNCRPAVDFLLRSLADSYGGESLAIIMTGMGDDGLKGCQLLKQQGSTIIAQDESSCVVYGMPRQIVEHGLADHICSLEQLPSKIASLFQLRATVCQ